MRLSLRLVLALGGRVYRWADAPPAKPDLIEIAERAPRATLCLETALRQPLEVLL